MTRSAFTAAAFGDDEALSSLVRAYHDRVYRFGVRVCRDAADADDAVQEAFIRLARKPEVMGDASVLSWLMTVVKNACLRLLRPFSRERRVLGVPLRDADDQAGEALDPEQALLRYELVQRVHAAIARLSPEQRAVIVLRDLEGHSGEETAAMLGIELVAMKSRLHRARQTLRASLEAA